MVFVMRIQVRHIYGINFYLIPKKWSEERFSLQNKSINVIYPNEKNVFMVPNHGKKEIITCIDVGQID